MKNSKKHLTKKWKKERKAIKKLPLAQKSQPHKVGIFILVTLAYGWIFGNTTCKETGN
jgi:hypothetical protein